MEGGNRVEGVHFFYGLFPTDIFQCIIQVYRSPVATKMDIPEMFGDLMRDGHLKKWIINSIGF